MEGVIRLFRSSSTQSTLSKVSVELGYGVWVMGDDYCMFCMVLVCFYHRILLVSSWPSRSLKRSGDPNLVRCLRDIIPISLV